MVAPTRLPPLNPLRNFEAAARLGSFRRAARELCVTEAAVSRQIKALEDHFGVPLFRRGDRRVSLTDAGQRFYPIVNDMFTHLRQAAAEMAQEGAVLRLYSTTSFALCWLLDRLPEFEAAHPDCKISLRCGTVLDVEFMTSNEIDASIIYHFEPPAAESSRLVRLVDERLIPVCAPKLLPAGRRLTMEELSRQRLLYNEPSGRDWRRWATSAAQGEFTWVRPIQLDSDSAAIRAATRGHGVALANILFIEGELAAGTLVPAVDCEPLLLGAHYLFCRRADTLATARVSAFHSWLSSALAAPKAKRQAPRDQLTRCSA